MAKIPRFTSLGTKTDTIDVRLSYRIVELFSEGLYASPNKAIEELVANSFDAGGQTVQVLLSPNLHDQDANIAVIDDGNGMDARGLKQHWLIGISNKRALGRLPRGRQQIGKFGIGKLATYVLAERLTHFSRSGNKYFSTSMDYRAIDRRVDRDLEPKTPIRLDLRTLTETEVKQALRPWTNSPDFKKARKPLFGRGASKSWTVTVMSSLKPKVHELKPGHLEWVLRTALPLRPDFAIWLNGKKLVPSKQNRGLLKKWILGKDLKTLQKPAPKNVSVSVDRGVPQDSEFRFGLEIPELGRVTGYAEVYKDLLTGKSEEIGRSYGFFVYVYGRLLNVQDGHFGISPNELRHGTFGRFRLVVHMDGLDQALRSNREAVSEGPLLAVAQDVLRAIFNSVRPTIEAHEANELPGAKLARRLATSPASLTRAPIIDLARSVLNGEADSRYLTIPAATTRPKKDELIAKIEERLVEAGTFVSGRIIDFNATASDGIAKYDVLTGQLALNAWHPFVAAFHDEFVKQGAGQPLDLFAMAEVLAEAHLHAIGVKKEHIDDFLDTRDELLRTLANDSDVKTPFSIALQLREARNNADLLEQKVCEGIQSLGFEVTPIGGSGKPDGVANALLAATDSGQPQHYSVSLEAKSKKKDEGKVAAGTVKVSTVARHRDAYDCQHALVVGRAFPTTRDDASSALRDEIAADRTRTKASGDERTITLITIDDLARLVRMRPIKQLGLKLLREMFVGCALSYETATWIDRIEKTRVVKPPYSRIIRTIESLQKRSRKRAVKFAALSNELSHLSPPIEYERDDELIELCRAMAQMAPTMLYARSETVELDQSAANVIAAIEVATKEFEVPSSK